MAIVQVGRVILQVGNGRGGWQYRAGIRQQIEGIIIDVVGRCFREALEVVGPCESGFRS
jgi:hypothetical protein